MFYDPEESLYLMDSREAISYKDKNMKNLLIAHRDIRHPLSFVNCDLSYTVACSFFAKVTFEDCILDGTAFIDIIHHTHDRLSFRNCKTDNTYFDSDVRNALKSQGKITP